MLKAMGINEITYGKKTEGNVAKDRVERNSNLYKEEEKITDSEKE